MKRRQVWMWTGLGISLAFLVYLFAGINYGHLWISLASANVSFLLPAGVLMGGTLAIRAWRWGYLLKPLKPVSFPSLMSATSIGLMANMVLPARLGELVRAFVLGHREHLDKSASFATIIVERLLDGFTILFILAVLLLLAPLPLGQGIERTLRWGGLVTLLVYVGVFTFLLYLQRSTARTVRGVQRVCARLPVRYVDKLCRLLESFSGGLQTLRQREYLGRIIVGSAALWGAVGVYNFLIVLAFQLQVPLTVGFLLLVFQAFAVMVPSSPGFVGTYHAASVACLTLWGISTEMALGVALVMHALGFFLTVGTGFICLWTAGLSLRDLTWADAALHTSPSSPT
ncbi:MAG: flippase-like domain-containing protein [Nitrospinae bacterium]|nr:flippase-like domain-containing protein [Nitrospinota bacterium]